MKTLIMILTLFQRVLHQVTPQRTYIYIYIKNNTLQIETITTPRLCIHSETSII